jgi:IS30 family transposase
MRVYTQLTQEQRYQICALMKSEHKQVEIVTIVGVDKSTISREVRRNCGLRGYRPQQAHQLALHRRQAKISPEHWQLIERLLREDWSPEQISPWLAEEGHLAVSHE